MGDERRQHERQPVTLIVEYPEIGDLLADYTENLSQGGLFVCTNHRFLEGESVCLVLSFPGLLKPCRVEGIVRWTKRDGEEKGIGVEVKEGESEELLANFMDKLQAGDPSVVARQLKILIADKNDYVKKLLEDGIRNHGPKEFSGQLVFETLTAGDEIAAMNHLTRGDIDIALVDGKLPTSGALGILSGIQEAKLATTVIVVAKDEELLAAAKEGGATLVLRKPLRLSSVLGALRSALAAEAAK